MISNNFLIMSRYTGKVNSQAVIFLLTLSRDAASTQEKNEVKILKVLRKIFILSLCSVGLTWTEKIMSHHCVSLENN